MKSISTTDEAKVILAAAADLGEGALWHPREEVLYWVDINGCALHIYDPRTGENRTLPTGARIGTVVPVEGGDVLVALQTGIHRMDIRSGKLSPVVNPINDPYVRFNDGKCDPSGRFWVGTFHMGGKKGGCALYRLDGDGSLHTMLEGVSISNGIVWTADETTMFYIDTPTNCVQAFDYDAASGNISNGRVAFRIPASEGDPDGMSIDADGNLWIAMWGGGSVNCYDPADGRLLRQVIVAAPHSTSCAFGGADMQTLYITSARSGLSGSDLAANPHSGDLFASKLNVSGIPSSSFRWL